MINGWKGHQNEIWRRGGGGAIIGGWWRYDSGRDLERCGGVDRQTGVSKRGCGVATLATKGASEVFCTTLGAGGRNC